MNSTRTRRLTAGAVVVTLVAGLMAFVVMQPASADHANAFALELTPEISSKAIGENATIQAVLVDDRTGVETNAPAPIVVDFEVTGDADGDNPLTPDATCTIQTGTSRCPPTPAITAATARTVLVSGWIKEVGFVNRDEDEGRLSDPVQDCTTESSAGAIRACATGTPVPGSTAERDQTDVVSLQFTAGALRLNCEESVTAPRTEDAQVNCSVVDSNDPAGPVSGKIIDAENLNGANDPDSANGGSADYNDECVTGENGQCSLIIPAEGGGSRNNQIGTAEICAWIDGDSGDDNDLPEGNPSYNPAGSVNDGGACDTEPAFGSADETFSTTNADNNRTDRFQVEWQNRVLTSLDVAPDIPRSSTVGGSHTMTATALDQFGDKWTGSSTAISGEFFTGSPKDADANTPATPDLGTCDTNGGEGDEDTASCTFTYTSAPAPGTDVMCFWFGTAPAMTGSGTANATCTSDGAGEKLVGGTDAPRVDVVSKSWTAANTTTTTQPDNDNTTTVTGSDQGYTLVGSDGGIFTYGTSKFHGSTGDLDLNEPVVGMANKKGATGYWLVAKDGGIFSFGDAEFFGSTGDMKLNAPILGMEATPSGRGYYLFAADGGIFTFGDAVFHGSTGDRKLNAPAVGLAVNERGDGYWLVAQDGGIFSFGRVPFHGSTGDRKLNEPVFDMAPTAGDNGYWLVAKDGGIFSFGDAEGKFYGSAVGKTTSPVIGMGATPSFNGYWIADSQGAVFHFGDALFLGDRRGQAENAATVGFATVPRK